VSGAYEKTCYLPAGCLPASKESTSDGPVVFDYADLWQGEKSLFGTLEELYGERQLDSLGGSYGWPVRYRQVEDYEQLRINTLGQYLDAFTAGDFRLPYLRHLSINRAMPELRPMLRQPEAFTPNWADHPLLDRLSGPEIFIGQADTGFGHLHQDQVSVHVGFVQLKGKKEFVVFPPEDGRYLDTFQGREFPYEYRNSRICYSNLTNYERFPGLREARQRRIVLNEGQAMLLPAGWWHTTYNLTDSVSYSIRIINKSNVTSMLWRHLQGLPRLLMSRDINP
jgi:hypothetical protein